VVIGPKGVDEVRVVAEVAEVFDQYSSPHRVGWVWLSPGMVVSAEGVEERFVITELEGEGELGVAVGWESFSDLSQGFEEGMIA